MNFPKDPPPEVLVRLRDMTEPTGCATPDAPFGEDGLRKHETVHRYVLAEATPIAKPKGEFFTKQERLRMLVEMREASGVFYGMAFRARCHSFIEFAGFMNEFIKLCEEAERRDVDWTQSNAHNPQASLPMMPWHANYLGEKFGCIFAGSFARNPKLLEIFVAALKEG